MTINVFESNLQPIRYYGLQADEQLSAWERGEKAGYSTGFAMLDNYLRFEPETYTILAGRPSQGKTTLAMQWVRNVSMQLRGLKDNSVCAVFSAEMTGRQLVLRMASEMMGINSHKLRMGYGTKEEFASVRTGLGKVKELPIYIDEGAAPSTDVMLKRLEELHEFYNVRMMMFDFVELGGDKGDTEELRVGSIHKSLKAIAKKLKIPVLGLCQVSREVEKTANKIPQMAHLRYSGQAEQVADKVATIMRPEYYFERGMTVTDIDGVTEENCEGLAILNVVKFREGPVGTVNLKYEKEFGRFSDLPTERVYL
ncbi:MAG: hypothetical protein E6R03_13050 [Hyphomicrobiaceae bacterium]|nr:MAG: hypothetical protein E6R03_13050 [Hyphomicrobiaceae bacterium]